jgi:kynurenine formamidase
MKRFSMTISSIYFYVIEILMTEWFETGESWYPSKWGEGDQLGTLNLLNDQSVLRAIKIVKKGKIIQLSHKIFNGMPGRYSAHGPFFHLLSQRVYDNRPPLREPTKNKFGGALCRLEMVDHLGTHLDSLNHIAFDNKFYNGFDAFQESTTFGTYNLGIDGVPPIVTKGILVDLTNEKEMILRRGRPIMVDETVNFLSNHNISVEPGDAIFFHTGVSKLWETPEIYNQYIDSSPGIGYELSKWIAENDISVTGSDTPSTEVVPPEINGTRLPVHQYLITKSGVRMIDNIKLDELAKEKAYEFMFVCAPLKIKGSTASPVAPVAIF